MATRTTFTPSIDFKVWSSQLGTSDSFTVDLMKRLDSTINNDTKPTAAPALTGGVISSSTISQGSLSTLDDGKTSKSLSIISSQHTTTPAVYMEKTLEQSCQSFECFNNIKVKEHDIPSTSAAAAAAAIAAAKEEEERLSTSSDKRKRQSSINEKNVLRKSSAYFSQTIRKIKSTPTTIEKRPPSPGLVIKSKEKEEHERAYAKKPTTWWRKFKVLFT